MFRHSTPSIKMINQMKQLFKQAPRQTRHVQQHYNEEDEDDEKLVDISQLSEKIEQRKTKQKVIMDQIVDILDYKVKENIPLIFFFYKDDENDFFSKEAALEKLQNLRDAFQEIEEEFEPIFKKAYQKEGQKKNFYLEVVTMNEFQEVQAYKDKLPFLSLRKKLMMFATHISKICQTIIKNTVFEGLLLGVILFNSVMLSLDDPTTNVQTDLQNTTDFIFLIVYTIEMVLKIIAMGFMFVKNAYLRDLWNVIDFVIVMTGYLPYFMGQTVVNLSSLRSLRILRPLRTINKLKSLRDIIQALFSALGLLRDSIVILVFFYTIFAIAGLQLFMGVLKRRCYSYQYGIPQIGDVLCSDDSMCNKGFGCGKLLTNPDWNITNFDTFGWAFLMVYQVVTLEGWTHIMEEVELTFSPWIVLYFIAIVVVGAWFILNLTLAIIKVKFAEAQQNKAEELKPDKEYWDLQGVRKLGIFPKKQPLSYPEAKFYGAKSCNTQSEQQSQKTEKSLGDVFNQVVVAKMEAGKLDEGTYISNHHYLKPGLFQIPGGKQPTDTVKINIGGKGNFQFAGILGVQKSNSSKLRQKSIGTSEDMKSSKIITGRNRRASINSFTMHRTNDRKISNNSVSLDDEEFFNTLDINQNESGIKLRKRDAIKLLKSHHNQSNSPHQQQPTRSQNTIILQHPHPQTVSNKMSIKLNGTSPNRVDKHKRTVNFTSAMMHASQAEPRKRELMHRQQTFKGLKRESQHLVLKPIDEQEQILDESDPEIIIGNEQFQKNAMDLGIDDMFEYQTVDPQSRQQERKKSNKKSKFLSRQELKRMTQIAGAILDEDNPELTKDQQLLKESLQSSTRLITGVIPYSRLTEQFQSEDDVLLMKQKRELLRKEQLEKQYRQRIKIRLTYQEELDAPNFNKSSFLKKQGPRQQTQKTEKSTMIPKKTIAGASSVKRKKYKDDLINMNYETLQKIFYEGVLSESPEKQYVHKTSDISEFNKENQIQEKKEEENEDQYNQIKQEDVYLNNGQIKTLWSGFEVLTFTAHKYSIKLSNEVIKNLNIQKDDKDIWMEGIFGVIAVIRKHIKIITQSFWFEALIMLSVIINTIILALEGLIPDSSTYILDSFNFTFTIIFTVDSGLKLIGLGKDYFLDKFNIFDGAIVILSLVELTFLSNSGTSKISAFRTVRIFRVFRVLRVARLIRSLRYMSVILDVISRTMQSFIYIFLLMVLFLYIFTLLGMQVFGGAFDNQIRQNYNTFMNAFICSFQLLTIENWNDILAATLRSNVSVVISLLYLVTWIFIGNWVFLNLFLSVLLEGFEQRQMDEDMREIENEMEIVQNIDFEYVATQSENKSTRSFSQSSLKKQINVGFEYFSEEGLCESSLYIFDQQNVLRKLCYRIVKDSKFEGLILVMIFLTSLQLILDTYINFDTNLSLGLNLYFTIFFSIECVMKIIAFGFACSPSSYLTESWSILDFFIVLLSWFDMIMQLNQSNLNLGFIKVLRLFRTLRPLRFVSHNISMKLVVTALLESVSGILNVGIVVVLVWMMFAILGINLMSGKTKYCNTHNNINIDIYQIRAADCAKIPGAYWVSYDMNFDNILSGMVTLFVLSTLEGWPNYLYNFIDADDSGPIQDNSTQFFWFFMFFILIGSYFLLNLFIGVMSLSYNLATEKAKNQYLSDDQSNWIEIQRLIVQTRPFFLSQFSPENRFRAFLFKVLKSRLFEPLIMMCILLNIVTMMMNYETAKSSYSSALTMANYIFTIIFTLEAIIKLSAFGITGYFMNGWNQFDCFVVIASIADFAMLQFGLGIKGLKVGPQLARVFRVLRVTRLLRLIRSFQGLQKLILTTIYSLPKLLNVLSLLMLTFFIFSVLACQLFGNIKTGNVIGSDFNFSTFSSAFVLLFRCSTGEDWYKVMFDTTRLEPYCTPNVNCGSPYYIFFFIVYIVMIQFIMLQLFILVILQQFEENYINPDNPLQNFSDLESLFLDQWVALTENTKGEKLNEKQLVKLLLYMKQPLGMDADKEVAHNLKGWKELQAVQPLYSEEQIKQQKFMAILKKDAAKQIMQMGIQTNKEGDVYYNQVLFYFMKNHIGQTLHKNQKNPMGLELLEKEELHSLKKIRGQVQKMETKEVNPAVQYLFVSLSFKVWQKFAERYKQKHVKRLSQIDDGSYFSSSYESSENDDDNNKNEILFQVRERTDDSDIEDDETTPLNRKAFVVVPNTDVYKEDDTFGVFQKAQIENVETSRMGVSIHTEQAIDLPRRIQTEEPSRHSSPLRIQLLDLPGLSTVQINTPVKDSSQSSSRINNFIFSNQLFIENRIYVDGDMLTQQPPPVSPNQVTQIKVTTVTQQTFQIYQDQQQL